MGFHFCQRTLVAGGEGSVETLLLGNFSGLGVAGVSLEIIVPPRFLFLMAAAIAIVGRTEEY